MKKKSIAPKKRAGDVSAAKRSAVKKKPPPRAPVREEYFTLRLYVAGQSTRSTAAIVNLRRICEEHIPGRYEVQIIDLLRNPELAKADQIVAIPTLIKKLPVPVRRIIGDLSATERVVVGLELGDN